MSVVVVNVLTVPADQAETLERRFANRAGQVDQAAGFEGFELLRPVEGTDQYLVYTRWRSEDDFRAWQSSQSFSAGHAEASRSQDGAAQRPAATGSEVWRFEVVQEAHPR